MTCISDTEYAVSELFVDDFANQRYCVFDFEATGIIPETEHITQIGAVIVENGRIQESRSFNTLVKSPKPIPAAVEQHTGINNTALEHAPALQEVYDDFLAFTKDCILVTHAGYEFDLPLLSKECRLLDLPMITNKCLDTKALFSFLHPEIQDIIWTDYLIKHYKVNDRDLRRHDALADSILIGRIFLQIMDEFLERDLRNIAFEEKVIVKRFQVVPLA
ncbi:3'-5' exonuclease [Paenibacillus rhizovicinus]|uniref:3'-5' exonuclease n=1 Tax=Paenibacillus rhizovicinus TaxID=2704463 RepID=A0A6C0NYE6_9BACL|nr:3'-5' exonuclease [Paenibacillus rhizovicinus]QHW31219.1 3'-5' exonuclease [Paenibacillus rhizovicinus]